MRSFGRGSDDDQRFSAQVQRGFIAEYIKTEIPLSVQVCSSLLLPSHFLQLLPLLPLPLAISNFIAEYNAKSVMSGHYHGHTAPLSKLWSYGRYKFTPSVALPPFTTAVTTSSPPSTYPISHLASSRGVGSGSDETPCS